MKEGTYIVDGHSCFALERCVLRSGEDGMWYHDNVTGSTGMAVPATEESLTMAVRAMRRKWEEVKRDDTQG